MFTFLVPDCLFTRLCFLRAEDKQANRFPAVPPTPSVWQMFNQYHINSYFEIGNLYLWHKIQKLQKDEISVKTSITFSGDETRFYLYTVIG